MTPRRWGVGGWLVAAAAGLVAAGGLVGLLVWDRRLFLLAVGWMCSLWWAYRIPNRNLLAELEAAQMRLSAYNASDSRADLAEAPLTPPGGTTEVDPAPPSWMDQSGYRPPAHSENRPYEMCQGSSDAHVFEPGLDTDGNTDPRWCNTCGEPRPTDAYPMVVPAGPMTEAEADRLIASLQALPGDDDPAEQPFVHTPCGTPISVDDAGGEWCPTCQVEITHEQDPLACVYDRTDTAKVERIADGAAKCACPDCWAWLRTNGYLPDLDASDGPRSLPTPRID